MLWQKIFLFIVMQCVHLQPHHIFGWLSPFYPTQSHILFYQKEGCPFALTLRPAVNLLTRQYPFITVQILESDQQFPSPTLRFYHQGAYENYRGLNACKDALKTYFYIIIVS